ncbi:hypothetical protein L1280_003065 [Deinococcus sp. HSC-46F16]|nr:hypothetical protein [Deinococcus sp. HSC-46F16]
MTDNPIVRRTATQGTPPAAPARPDRSRFAASSLWTMSHRTP